MKQIVLKVGIGLLLVGSLINVALAQYATPKSSDLNQKVIVKESGRLFVDGKPSSQPKLDILPNIYQFRYKVVDKPKTPYNSITVTVQLPEAVSAYDIKPQIIAVHGIDQANYQPLNRSTIQFFASNVTTDATLTLLIPLPKDAFHFTLWGRFLAYVQTLPVQGLIIIGTVVPGLMVLYALALYLVRMRDVRIKANPPYATDLPAQLPPAMVGAIVNGYVGMKEIAATLIDLAHRGYIEIIYRDEANFAFSRKKPWENDQYVQEYEKLILNQMFTEGFLTESNDINQKLNSHIWSDNITKAIEKLYDQMVTLGYFPENPARTHAKIRFIGMMIFFISVIGVLGTLFIFDQEPFMVIPWLVSLISSPILIHLALLVPTRTQAGREQTARWLGFKNYLMGGVSQQHGAYTDYSLLFERYLAYAIVLGVEGYWVQQFSELPCHIPDWFFSQKSVLDSYTSLAQSLFGIIGFIGLRFSNSRKPTAI